MLSELLMRPLASDTSVALRISCVPWTMPSMTGLFSSTYPPGLTPKVDPGLWVNQLWQYEELHSCPPSSDPKSAVDVDLLTGKGRATTRTRDAK